MFRNHLRLAVLFTGVILIGLSTPSFASGPGSAFGSGWTARALAQGDGRFGGGIGLADANSFSGIFTYGMSRWTTGRVKLGFIDANDLTVAFGADFQWQFLSVAASSGKDPFDCSVGGLFEVYDAGVSVVQFGGFVNGSYPFALKGGGGTISPYVRVDGRIASYADNSDLRFGLHSGAEWELPKFGSFWAEFQIDGNDGVFLGVNFDVL